MDKMICTYIDYKKNYNEMLANYLNDYVDNTETSFLRLELEKYSQYYESLKKSDDSVSKNTITSLNRIINFLSKQLSILSSPNPISTAIYTHGEIPRLTTKLKTNPPKKLKVDKVIGEIKIDKKPESKEELENDYTKSSIEDYLSDIKGDINPKDYEILVESLYQFFTKGKFPKLEHKIKFNSVNKKKVGWALKEAYKNITLKNLDVEYFRFAKENINLFSDEIIDKENFRQSKFYKLFTTRP